MDVIAALTAVSKDIPDYDQFSVGRTNTPCHGGVMCQPYVSGMCQDRVPAFGLDSGARGPKRRLKIACLNWRRWGMGEAIPHGMGSRQGSKGAARELVVAADLLSRGYHVFRSVSPACPCDLLAMSENWQIARVEVKGTYELKSGEVKINSAVKYPWDILAGVLPSGQVVYRIADGFRFRRSRPRRDGK